MFDNSVIKRVEAKAELVEYLGKKKNELLHDAEMLLRLRKHLKEDIRDCDIKKLTSLLDNFNTNPLAARFDDYEKIWPLEKLINNSRGPLLGDYQGLFSKVKSELQDYHEKRRLLETLKN